MAPHRKTAAWFGGLLILVGTLALAGCGGSSAAAKPTATPDAATILANVQKTKFTDLEFTMSLSGTTAGTSVDGTFSGIETTSPSRSDITFSFTSAGSQFAGEMIIDTSTSTTYVKLTSPSIPGVSSDTWIKSSGNSSLTALPVDPTTLTNLSSLTGATLKDSESLDGVEVWHFQGNDTISGSASQVDVYVRKDNNQLYEFVANSGTGTDTGKVTFKVTGENTGKTISLPPADQVQG